jgi:hypothetical protein
MINESLLWQSIGSGYLLLSTFCFWSYVKRVVHTVKINDLQSTPLDFLLLELCETCGAHSQNQ